MTDTTTTTSRNDAHGILNSALSKYGLGTLATWAWRQYTKGASIDQIMLDLRDRPEYKARFPAMEALSQAGHALSESQYIAQEQQYAQIMHAAGLPPGFYDKPEDFATLFTSNLSPSEVQARVTNGYAAAVNAPPEVKAQFEKFYGAGSDAALAAWFLDPDKAEPVLEQQLAAATVAGVGSRFGIDPGFGTSMQLAQEGVTAGQAQSGFGAIQKEAGLFNENVGENQDLQANKEGVQSQFGLSPAAIDEVRRRQGERQAAFAGSGAAQSTRAGAVGLGEAGQP